MKKFWYVFVAIGLIIIGFAVFFYVKNSDKVLLGLAPAKKIDYSMESPNTTALKPDDVNNCFKLDTSDIEGIMKLTDQMRNYLYKEENISSKAPYVGRFIEGTSCFRLQISNLEVFATLDDNLVIFKNGKEYKNIPPIKWKL